MTAPPTPVRVLARLPGLDIAVQPDPSIAPGHQWLLFAGERAADIADLLGGEYGQTMVWSDYIAIPHTAVVDQRLKRLIDALVNLRLVAPGLVQLELVGFNLEPQGGALAP